MNQLTNEQQMQCANDLSNFTNLGRLSSIERANSISTEFVRLEVQIATLLFALIGFFINSFVGIGSLNYLAAKAGLSFSVFFLILSLVMGLLHLKREERFLDNITRDRSVRFANWRKAAEGEISLGEAKLYHKGTMTEGGMLVSSPQWPWILQTIFLGLGIASLFVLLLTFIFS